MVLSSYSIANLDFQVNPYHFLSAKTWASTSAWWVNVPFHKCHFGTMWHSPSVKNRRQHTCTLNALLGRTLWSDEAMLQDNVP